MASASSSTDSSRKWLPSFIASGTKGLHLRTVGRWMLLVAAAGAISRTVFIGRHDIGLAVEAMVTTSSHLLVLALVLEAFWTYCLSQVYRCSLIAFGGHATRYDAIRVSMGAFTLSRVLPGGGTVGSLLAAREFISIGNPATLTLIAMITGGWVSLVTLAAVVTTGVAFGAQTGALNHRLLIAPVTILIGLVVFGAVMGLIVNQPRLRRGMAGLLVRMFGRWSPDLAIDDLTVLLSGGDRRTVRRLLVVGCWATASWVLDAATLWVVLSAFGIEVEAGVLSIGYGSANLLQALPELTPGWLGVLETTMSAIFSSFGTSAALAAVAVLSYRLLSFWIPVALGIPFGLQILRGRGSRKPLTRCAG